MRTTFQTRAALVVAGAVTVAGLFLSVQPAYAGAGHGTGPTPAPSASCCDIVKPKVTATSDGQDTTVTVHNPNGQIHIELALGDDDFETFPAQPGTNAYKLSGTADRLRVRVKDGDQVCDEWTVVVYCPTPTQTVPTTEAPPSAAPVIPAVLTTPSPPPAATLPVTGSSLPRAFWLGIGLTLGGFVLLLATLRRRRQLANLG